MGLQSQELGFTPPQVGPLLWTWATTVSSQTPCHSPQSYPQQRRITIKWSLDTDPIINQNRYTYKVCPMTSLSVSVPAPALPLPCPCPAPPSPPHMPPAPEWIKAESVFCHHNWFFWVSNPWLTARRPSPNEVMNSQSPRDGTFH